MELSEEEEEIVDEFLQGGGYVNVGKEREDFMKVPRILKNPRASELRTLFREHVSVTPVKDELTHANSHYSHSESFGKNLTRAKGAVTDAKEPSTCVKGNPSKALTHADEGLTRANPQHPVFEKGKEKVVHTDC